MKCIDIHCLMTFTKTVVKERQFCWLGSHKPRLIQYFIKALLSTIRKVKTFIWKVRIREVTYECDNLRRVRKRLEFEQEIDVEICGALIAKMALL